MVGFSGSIPDRNRMAGDMGVSEPLDATAQWVQGLQELWHAAGRPTGKVVVRQAAAQRPPVRVGPSAWSAWLKGENVPSGAETARWLLVFLRAKARTETPGFRAPSDGRWMQTWQRARDERRQGSRGGGRPVSWHAPAPCGTLAGLAEPPPLPGTFLARQVPHDQIVDALLEDACTAGHAPIVALVGMGGSGKTFLAQAAARDRRVASAFPDGVVWLSAGGRSAAGCQAELLAVLGVSIAGDDVEAGVNALRRRLASARCLVVIDDVTGNDQRVALDVFGPGSALLVTTRDHETVPHGQRKLLVAPLDPAQARSMLAAYAGIAEAELPGQADEVLARCGGLPLAVAICGGMVGDGQPWTSLVTLLRKPRPDALAVTFRDYRHTSLLAAVEASTGGLPSATRELYEDLAVFAGRGPVPVSVAARLWGQQGLDPDESRLAIARLAKRSLLTYRPADGTFALHDLLYDYTRFRAARRLPDLHGRLAAAFLRRWGGLDGGLAEAISHFGPPARPSDDDLYGLLHVTDHLVQAGRDDLLYRLLAAESGPGGRTNTWFALHERSERTAEYLLDLDLARGRAQQITDRAASPADQAEGIALEFRYALIRSSIVSLAGTVPAGILAALARRRIWTFDRAQAYAEMMPDAEQRSDALRRLARFRGLPEHRKTHLVELAGEAAEGIDYAMRRAFSLVWLVGLALPERREFYLERALEAADTDRQRSQEIRAWLFGHVARWFPERSLQELRAGARRRDGSAHHYLGAMTAALPELPALYEDVLAFARTDRYSTKESKALRAVLLASEPDERARLVAERLAAYDPAQEKRFNRLIVEELAPYLPGDELRGLLDQTLDGASPVTAARLLAAAIPHLPAEERPELLDKALQILRTEKVDLRRGGIAALLPLMPEPRRTRLLEDTFDALFRAHRASAVWTACEIARFLPEHLLRRVIDHVGEANPPEDALNQLAPHLTPGLLRHFLGTRMLDKQGPSTRALVHLAPGQPSATLSRILGFVSTEDHGEQRVSLLTELAPHLPDSLIADAVRVIPADVGPEPHARLLVLLAARAAPPDREELLRRARDLATSESHPHHRYRSLVQSATDPQQLGAALHLACVLDRPAFHHPPPQDPQPLPDTLIDQASRLARTAHGPCRQASSLAGLIPYAAPVRRAVLLREAAMAALIPHDHEDDVPCDGLHALERAAAGVPDEDRLPLLPGHPTPLTAVDDQGDQGDEGDHVERLRRLSCLLAYLPARRRGPVLEAALDCLTALSFRWDMDWASRHGHAGLSTVAPYLNPDARQYAARLARTLGARYQTADVLADLAAYADPATRPGLLDETVSYLRTLTSAYELDGPLATLAPHLDPNRAAELLDRLLHLVHGDRGWDHGVFPETISRIAPHLTPALLDQAANAVRQHASAPERAEASRALARAADALHPDPWPAYWRTALADATATGRPGLFSLVADLPLHHRQDTAAPLIQAVLDIHRWWPSNGDHGNTAGPPSPLSRA